MPETKELVFFSCGQSVRGAGKDEKIHNDTTRKVKKVAKSFARAFFEFDFPTHIGAIKFRRPWV